MSLLPHQLELLAPARNADIGIEAINHGADAVYIGGPAFGARATAGNALADLERLIAHAHRFHSRIFITLNTILRDDELEDARRMAWQVYEAGADALIVQDMGLLQLDLPPIQLHASTQTDIRTPEKARFLQDVGFSQIVPARELDLAQIAAIRDALQPSTTIEFFVHGALCVAYSGQCFISHAHTGRSANRGDCNQACRLPYEVLDAQGRILAHEKHVLSMKDNNQSNNLRALIGAGVRSFKIEGRYKDMGYVKNITAHYRKLLDEIVEEGEFTRAASGRTTFSFTPDPDQNFNREFTDYFVQGRQIDIGAFDTPKTPGRAIGWVTQIGPAGDKWFELEVSDKTTQLHNGDGLCYYDLQKELVGIHVNRAECVHAKKGIWRIFPKDALTSFKDLRKGLEINRNRDMDWNRTLEKKSSDRRIGLWASFSETPDGFALTLTDEDGFTGHAHIAQRPPSRHRRRPGRGHAARATGPLWRDDFCGARHRPATERSPGLCPPRPSTSCAAMPWRPWRAPAPSWLARLPRATPVQPPVPFPEDTLTYLANVFNHQAHDFYVKHGVKVIDAAYESKEEEGEVSLMITKHCVRFSMSLCPKQAKGVVGVKGTIKAEPLQLINGKEKLKLVFDCKPCEMHVVGKMKKSVLHQHERQMHEQPLQFYRTRPAKNKVASSADI
jgi:collagenase-like PrtC family protease